MRKSIFAITSAALLSGSAFAEDISLRVLGQPVRLWINSTTERTTIL
ncbi:lipoprotein [Marinomonas sp. GJ51-6]|nr:lipoprotein [Marinomonas sp. GJ51-6]WOD07647.1 lipoprotein [Marinomonas sp. GJ51-6]